MVCPLKTVLEQLVYKRDLPENPSPGKLVREMCHRLDFGSISFPFQGTDYTLGKFAYRTDERYCLHQGHTEIRDDNHPVFNYLLSDACNTVFYEVFDVELD